MSSPLLVEVTAFLPAPTSPRLYKCINVPMFHVLFIRSGVRVPSVARVYIAVAPAAQDPGGSV